MSEDIPIPQSVMELSDFEFVLGMWCEQAGITQKEYKSLQEVLKCLTNLQLLHRLPLKLNTLKRHCCQKLSLLKLWRKEVDVDPLKLSTLSTTAKRKLPGVRIVKDYVYFLDPKDLFQRMLSSSKFCSELHISMADFVDNPTELWHSFVWGSSICVCSGDYAYYLDMQPIFLSDIVYYKCENRTCSC